MKTDSDSDFLPLDSIPIDEVDETNNLDPVTNPDAQEALSRHYSNAVVMILPLTSGRLAIIDRSYSVRYIIDEPPTLDELVAWSRSFETRLKHESVLAAEARFFGEPDTKTLARDLRDANRPKRPSKLDLAIEIEL